MKYVYERDMEYMTLADFARGADHEHEPVPVHLYVTGELVAFVCRNCMESLDPFHVHEAGTE